MVLTVSMSTVAFAGGGPANEPPVIEEVQEPPKEKSQQNHLHPRGI